MKTIQIDDEYFRLIDAIKAADEHRELALKTDPSVFKDITNDPAAAHMAAIMAAATQADVAILNLGRYIYRKQQAKV